MPKRKQVSPPGLPIVERRMRFREDTIHIRLFAPTRLRHKVHGEERWECAFTIDGFEKPYVSYGEGQDSLAALYIALVHRIGSSIRVTHAA